MKRKQRRGQAALEFLTTYGWAFLVVLVMIGALAYFGVIDPNRFLPDKCLFQQEFNCRDFLIDSTNETVYFVMQNNLGTGANGIILQLNTTDGQSVTCTPNPGSLNSGQAKEWECDYSSVSIDEFTNVGQKVRFNMVGEYQTVSGRYPRQMSGEIFGTVQ